MATSHAADLAESIFKASKSAQKITISQITVKLTGDLALHWSSSSVNNPRLGRFRKLRNFGGRTPTTEDMAEFVNERKPLRTYKEIAAEWAAKYPRDPRTAELSSEKLRVRLKESWRRFKGDKTKKRLNRRRS